MSPHAEQPQPARSLRHPAEVPFFVFMVVLNVVIVVLIVNLAWFLPFLPDRYTDTGWATAIRAAYIGLLLKKLEETGELDNTLIVVSGDHGMPGVSNGKCNLYDFGTGVTLAAR